MLRTVCIQILLKSFLLRMVLTINGKYIRLFLDMPIESYRSAWGSLSVGSRSCVLASRSGSLACIEAAMTLKLFVSYFYKRSVAEDPFKNLHRTTAFVYCMSHNIIHSSIDVIWLIILFGKHVSISLIVQDIPHCFQEKRYLENWIGSFWNESHFCPALHLVSIPGIQCPLLPQKRG